MNEVRDPSSSPVPRLSGYPRTVFGAGIIWIVIGAGIIASFALPLPVKLIQMVDADSPRTGAALVEMAVGMLFQGVLGGFFLYEGIGCCRGTLPSTIGMAVGSIFFGLIILGIAVFLREPKQGYQWALVIPWVLGLFAAGVLTLMGQAQYDAWLKVEARQRGKREDG